MKKAVSMALCAAMALATLTGCGSGSSAASSAAGSAAPAAAASPEKVYTIKLSYTPGSLPAEDSPDIMYAEVFKK